MPHNKSFICLWRRSLFVVCLSAVTYKRIVPRQRVLHNLESSRETNRGNASRKRKKPGAGMYYTCNFHMTRACLRFNLRLHALIKLKSPLSLRKILADIPSKLRILSLYMYNICMYLHIATRIIFIKSNVNVERTQNMYGYTRANATFIIITIVSAK